MNSKIIIASCIALGAVASGVVVANNMNANSSSVITSNQQWNGNVSTNTGAS